MQGGRADYELHEDEFNAPPSAVQRIVAIVDHFYFWVGGRQ